MKKILICISFLLAIISLVGCIGQTTTGGGNGGGTGPDINGGNTPDDSNLIEYTARIYRNGRLWAPNIDIYAVFDNESSTSSVLIDGFTGEAKFKGDGEYNVHLSTVPTGYTYDPNVYTVTPQHTEVNIELSALQKPINGTGAYSPISQAYQIEKNGFYTVTIDSPDSMVYFQIRPSMPGEYQVESVCDIYADTINPQIYFFDGHVAYRDESNPHIANEGGTSLPNGYTKNFTYNFTWDQEQLNNWQNFGIRAEQKYSEYPVEVTFRVKYLGEYHMDYPDRYPVYPTEEIKNVITESGTTLKAVSAVSRDFDQFDTIYDPNEGVWRKYDASAEDNFGPKLVAYVNTTIPSLDFSFETIRGHEPYGLCIVDECFDYFLFGNGPLKNPVNGEALQYFGDSYAAHCNGDGVCYVTNELKDFLQRIAIQRSMFYDGQGILERNGYSSGQNNQWLFACGYYD